MRAYVTLLSTLSYLPAVIVLCKSLRQVGATYPLCVAISQTIPQHVHDLLRQKGTHVIRLPGSIEISKEIKEKSGHWGNTFDKPHMSAFAAGRLAHPAWERLNSGLMVIEPAPQLPEKIAATLE